MNKWRHITLTYDGTRATLYINGVQDGQTSPFTYIPTTANKFFINHNWGAYHSDFTYDDVRFYTASLPSNM